VMIVFIGLMLIYLVEVPTQLASGTPDPGWWRCSNA
jgi:hypothetical protein